MRCWAAPSSAGGDSETKAHSSFNRKPIGSWRMYKAALPTLLAILTSNAASADVVRRNSVPDSYWGTWVTTGSILTTTTLSAKTYADTQESCAVIWVSETAGVNGPIYSAHLQCSHRPEQTGERFPLNLIIWPKSADEIAVGPSFMSLKIFRRCRATHMPPSGTARSRETPLDGTETGSQSECPIITSIRPPR